MFSYKLLNLKKLLLHYDAMRYWFAWMMTFSGQGSWQVTLLHDISHLHVSSDHGTRKGTPSLFSIFWKSVNFRISLLLLHSKFIICQMFPMILKDQKVTKKTNEIHMRITFSWQNTHFNLKVVWEKTKDFHDWIMMLLLYWKLLETYSFI